MRAVLALFLRGGFGSDDPTRAAGAVLAARADRQRCHGRVVLGLAGARAAIKSAERALVGIFLRGCFGSDDLARAACAVLAARADRQWCHGCVVLGLADARAAIEA